ncbi:cell division protein FtsZ [Ancylomarina longa]|uniref:Cell division protein FtsZ n=1 Tax=Ancylomarina longa TaxID=2487017 RepID=A0A434AUL1_9BACT|nr:cell division protein FtsZ [Ancylomarina longa]RUT78150.1 cell division protein FtsZ [Ancylomarina longa]
MTEDLIDFSLPENESSIIKVIGVGGGGGNAVNYMYQKGIKDVDFVICNTDAQALENSMVPVKIQLGESLTEGRGAGNKPERGEQSAIENLEDINELLAENTKMVFITAGMGGGTGTGAAPVIAKAAKDLGVLTVGIVTIPFRFEGRQRLKQAFEGINRLKENVDSLLVINNEKLSEIYGDLKLSSAFSKADDVLSTAAKGIAEIITLHGYINVDFEDVKTVMTDSGVAVMGSANAEGENRAVNAIKEALTSPLLNSNDVRGARNILLNITSGGEEVTMDEVGQITDYVQEAVGDSASIIWGTGQDTALNDKVSVTIIATGFDNGNISEDDPSKSTFQARRVQNNISNQSRLNLKEEQNDSQNILEQKLILTNLKDTEIDEIESIPAFKRKQKILEKSQFQSGNVIKFTLDEEE